MKQFKRPSSVYNLNPIRFTQGAPQKNPLRWEFNTEDKPSCESRAAALPVKLPPVAAGALIPAPIIKPYQDFAAPAPAYYQPPAPAYRPPEQQPRLRMNEYRRPALEPPSFVQPAPAGYVQPAPAGYAQPAPAGYVQPEPAGYAQPAPEPEQPAFVQPAPAGYVQPEPEQPAFAQPAPEPVAIEQQTKNMTIYCATIPRGKPMGYSLLAEQIVQLFYTSPFAPKVALWTWQNIFNQYFAKALNRRQIKWHNIRTNRGNKKTFYIIESAADLAQIKYFQGITLLCVGIAAPPRQELQNEQCFVIEFEFNTIRKYFELHPIAIDVDKDAPGGAWFGVGAIDYDRIIDHTQREKAVEMAGVIENLNRRVAVLSSRSLEYLASLLRDRNIPFHYLKLTHTYDIQADDLHNAQILLYEYDPLIGQSNSNNINSYWPERLTYLMETPINSIALNYLVKLKYVDHNTSVLTAVYSKPEHNYADLYSRAPDSSDQYFEKKTRENYGL